MLVIVYMWWPVWETMIEDPTILEGSRDLTATVFIIWVISLLLIFRLTGFVEETCNYTPP